ncbi:MAG: apolipoprotein N-acyltransferase [Candidatus Acidiferrales bacterium]|jgi:apolipoprotein N-acyltransferase|nr:apolipoprotein N-acyltransferase [Candidatus Acidoferrales bacterium]
MNLSRPVRFLLAIGSGLALPFSFPNYNLPLLAWIAVAMLILASLGARKREAALYGFINGALFYPLSVPWIDTVMQQYGNVSPLASAGILALMTLAGTLFPIVFAVLVSRVGKRSITMACVFAPFLWVALEFARTHLPIIGFPWNLIGYAASGNLAFVQLTSVTGIFGLSLLVVGFNALVVWAIASPSQKSRRAVLVALLILLGVARIGPRFVPRAVPDRVAHLVQTNFAQSESYPANWMDLHAADMQQLENMSIDAARKSHGVIIWPEVPAPFSLQDAKFAAIANRIAHLSEEDFGEYFLVGVVDWKLGPNRQWLASNSAVLLDPSGQRQFTYDKIHLVPFGEYVPLRRWLTFAKSLTMGISDFTPGHTYAVGNLPGGRFSVFICYESIFPALVRRFAANGAELLVNISNDGWFGRSSAPLQHLMMLRVRAVENRRWLLRDTNTGYTVDVDPYGRIVARLQPFTRAELDAPYAFRSDLTPYTRFGDWLAWLCVIATILLLVVAFTRRLVAR